MKRSKKAQAGERRRGKSPYNKYGKREFDYSQMYRRNPHLAACRRAAAANALSDGRSSDVEG